MRRLSLVVFLGVLFAAFTSSSRTWYIRPDGTGDALTIQAGIDSAVAGDTVLVTTGTYREWNIHMKSGIVLLSETGQPDCVTIDADRINRVLACDQCDNRTLIKGFTISDGAPALPPVRYGGGLWCHMSTLTVADCVISDNFADNGGGAICLGGSPVFTRCVFQNNYAGEGGGVSCDLSSPEFVNCTFYGNTGGVCGGGIYCYQNSSPTLDDTIIAFSTAGDAIFCEYESNSPVLRCCDIYGNPGGDWVGCIADQLGINGNFSGCPSFCNADGGDFRLCDESPCLPGNHPDGYDCGLIGAWGEGCSCGPSATEPTTWGSIKAMYR